MTTSVRNAPRRNRPSGTEIAALVFVTGFGVGFICLCWQIVSNTVEAAAYHQAVPCGSGHGTTSTDCLYYREMKVTNKDTVELENLPDLCYLDLQDAIAPRLHIEVDSGLYSAVSVGSIVSVKFWRGEAMIVTGGGTRSGTENHPDRENHRNWLYLVIFGLGAWLFASGYISERRRRIRNSIPDVPWVATHLKPTRFQQWEVTEDADELTMIRQPQNSPVLFLCLFITTLVLTVYCIVYFDLHPAEFAAYLWIVAIVEMTLLALTFGTWNSVRTETQAFQRGKTPRYHFARGGTSVTRNYEALGAVQRIFMEELTIGDDEKGKQCLRVTAENGQMLHLGWIYPNDMAAIRPFATHLAAFLNLPLEFTKEEKPGND